MSYQDQFDPPGDTRVASMPEEDSAPSSPDSSPDTGLGTEDITDNLYAMLLGVMDQQANTDLMSGQISQLSNILNQQASLAGKDLQAGRWAAGGGTATDISGILRGQQQALSSGITDIQAAGQARIDQQRMFAMDSILNLRSQLSAEEQAGFDRDLQERIFDWQKKMDQEELDLASDEAQMEFWASIISSAAKAVPFLV